MRHDLKVFILNKTHFLWKNNSNNRNFLTEIEANFFNLWLLLFEEIRYDLIRLASLVFKTK